MFIEKLVGSSKYACEQCQFADYNVVPGKFSFSDLFTFSIKKPVCMCVCVECVCV